MKEARCGAAFLEKFVPVSRIEGNVPRLRAKSVYFVGYLPLATAHRQHATLQIKITQLHIADLLHTEPCIDEQCQKRFITRTENSVLLTVSSSQQRINGFSGKGSRRQRFCWNILNVGHGILKQHMMGKSPATIAPQRGQSTVNGGRSCAVIALTSQPPVAQVFMPQQRWIEGPLSGAFPPGREMGQVLADDLHGGGCAMLGVQEREILLNRRRRADSAPSPTCQGILRVAHAGEGDISGTSARNRENRSLSHRCSCQGTCLPHAA